jgi:hypothetical protein
MEVIWDEGAIIRTLPLTTSVRDFPVIIRVVGIANALNYSLSIYTCHDINDIEIGFRLFVMES